MLWFALGFLIGGIVGGLIGFMLAVLCNVAANESVAPILPDEQRKRLLDYDNDGPLKPSDN